MYQEPKQVDMLSDEPIVDIKAVVNFSRYIKNSIQRHTRLVVLTVLMMSALVATLVVVLPRMYKISMRVLTHKSLLMNSLVHPDRAVPQTADNPTSGAIELIKSRENLENLMTDIKLQEIFQSKRSAVFKLKDNMLAWLHLKPSEQDIHEAFLKLLDERIVPMVENEVVLIDVEWPDPDIAMSLAEATVARFLKMRHDMELSEVVETVHILERNVDNSRRAIEMAVSHMQKIFNEKERELDNHGDSNAKERRHIRKNRVIAVRKPISAEQVDPAVDDLRRALADKQAAVATLRRAFDARVKKAEEELANMRSTLGPDHPDVADAKRTLESLSQPPPELLALQAEQNHLAEQLGTLASTPSKEGPRVQVQLEHEPMQDTSFDMVRVPVSEELYQELQTDPEIASIMDELKKREDNHDDLVRRLAAARIESETANVAFEYRYIMTMPPVYPKKFVKPNIPMMIGGGLFVGLVLGVLFAVLADVLSKKILEPWQIERFLNVRLLGDIHDQNF